ncbi:MAG TPA: hypothetical protein VFS64_06595 [Solirubrobacterales bacterium]|nr:hypothetical protein [Solirubrobacterales bacterium]
MGRLSALLLALILGGASAVALSACGGGSDAKLLPGRTASQIESNLDEVQQLVASGDCVGAEDAVAAVTTEVEELNDVAAKLKAALQEGTAKLSEVVSRCEEESVAPPETATEPDVEAEELEQKELEAEEKAQERAEKQARKEEEKAEAPKSEEGNLPPQSEGKGKAKGHEEVAPPPAPAPEPEESEAGGVSPGVGVE